MPIDPPTFTGKQFVDSTIAIKAAIPWRSLMASMTLLDSHDTARFRTVVGKRFDRHLAGMTLLMTYPGVPSIFAGDEIGLEGAWGEDARRSMPWGQPDKWDHDFFNETRALISIRKSSDALVNGGLRFVKVENEYFAFLRESGKQSLLVVVWRDKCKIQVDLKQLGVTVKTSLYEFGVGQAPSIDGTSLISFNPKHAGAAIFEVR
jgi:alpha-glucosidase